MISWGDLHYYFPSLFPPKDEWTGRITVVVIEVPVGVLGGGAPGGLATSPLFAWRSPLYFERTTVRPRFFGGSVKRTWSSRIPHSPYHLIVTTESDAGYVSPIRDKDILKGSGVIDSYLRVFFTFDASMLLF